jgi:adenine-specific DNA methylase
MTDRRFIEETFPVKEVSEESAKEKNVRHGHISTFHIWWARRPLAACRSTNFASLIRAPETKETTQKTKAFLISLCKWENSLNHTILREAEKQLLQANGGKPPRILDPFAGGGGIALEALRLGCETYASDYNPVSVLIMKCTLEYPQKYVASSSLPGGLAIDQPNPLIEDIEKWAKLVRDEVERDIGGFYPNDDDGSSPIGYFWARTIPCQNPACNAEIPLMRQYWLAKKDTKKVALYPDTSGGRIKFKIVGTGYEKIPRDFDPEKGSVSRGIVTCPVCSSVIDGDTTKALFGSRRSGEKMMAVVLRKDDSPGKKYRLPNDADMKIFKLAEGFLQDKKRRLLAEWGLDPVPDEPIPPKKSHRAVGSQLPLYNFQSFGDLFNSRQKLALVTFVEKVRLAHEKMISEALDAEYATAITTYLGLAVDELARFTSSLNPWKVDAEAIVHVFGRQTLAMVWDYVENNPLGGHGGTWDHRLAEMMDTVKNVSSFGRPGHIEQGTATRLSYADGSFDAVFTDPPYYDNVPYSYLSDFFYVWLKRSLAHLYPNLFSTPLTPKAEEIVAYQYIPEGYESSKEFFEKMLEKSFKQISRVLRPNGLAIIVYAHKSTAGWETLINSLLGSGLVVTGAWPIHTEMEARLTARETATLASSIYIISRKLQRQEAGFYREVKEELAKHLNAKLDRLWNEGISGADFLVSAIGSSIEVFGKHERIIDDEGNVIRADMLLEDVRRIVIDYAIRQVLRDGFASEINPLTRFYVLWRWAYGESSVVFDDARKLAQSVGIDIANEWNKGFIRKDKEFISVLGPEDRKIEDLQSSTELIDVLHRVLVLWKKGRNDDVVSALKESGYGKSDVFFRVAQAVSESLQNGKEKKLLEGFLSGKGRIAEQVVKETGQARLFE